MKSKIIFSIAAIVVLIAATAALIAFNYKQKQNNKDPQTPGNTEETGETAGFDMEYPDRLGGIPVTGIEKHEEVIIAHYGDGKYISKDYAADVVIEYEKSYGTTSEQSVNGMNVHFKDKDGIISLAVWRYNDFIYIIYIDEGVEEAEMIEYIESTR